jgi:CheY-like chemotaxis protein
VSRFRVSGNSRLDRCSWGDNLASPVFTPDSNHSMTCIRLTLDTDPPEPWQSRPELRPQPKGPGLGRILIAEDDEDVMNIMGRMLEEAGYEVLTASDGLQALHLMDSGDPVDLVITDIRMPRMGGLALSERVESQHPGLPIIYITGYASEFNPLTPEGLPRPFLRKPFTEQDLIMMVERLLGPG